MMTEDFKKDTNNCLKEIQDNTDKQLERGNIKSLKELQENTTKNVKELNKATQDEKSKKGFNKEIIKGNNPRDRKPGKR